MARTMKYKTKAEFEAAVLAYFRSITVIEPLTYLVPTGKNDSKGKPKYSRKTATDDDGNTCTIIRYLRPPTVFHLCMFLGISTTTWSAYAERKGYAEIVTRARMMMEAYLAEELLTRDVRKGIDGVKFMLSHNYGWGEKQVVEQTVTTKSAPLTSAEKSALYAELMQEVRGEYDCDAGQEA